MYILDRVKGLLVAEIEAAVQAAVKEAGIEVPEALPEVGLEVPHEKAHGDFSTNIAMQLTKVARRNPRDIAQMIIDQLDAEKAGVAKVDIAGPGFINFHMDKKYLLQVIPQVLAAQGDYGRVDAGKGKKVQVEFVSANPTGSLHLGHARGAAVGDALCNVLSFAGYDVSREYYINDAGNQVDNLARSLEVRYLQALGQEAEMPEDGYYGDDIIAFGQELAAAEGDRLTTLPEAERQAYFLEYGLKKQLDQIKKDLADFGVHFDAWFSESTLYEGGQIDVVLQKLEEKGHIYEEDGATWLRTTTFGDDKDRVLIKKDGTYTYLTPDIAYHENKYSRGFAQLINIWGADHHGYVQRMKAAMRGLGYDDEQLLILIGQMVSLYQNGERVRMSKRTGKAVTMRELMEEVGTDAVRYFFTMRSLDSQLDFDMDLAVSKSNENPVYYVQYAHARICSIFKQAEEQGVVFDNWFDMDYSILMQGAGDFPEADLLLKLAQLGEEVHLAAEQYAPHRLVRYVYELASHFHSYYRAVRVITEHEQLTQARLALLGATQIVINNVLSLIGVTAPEQM